MKLYEFKGKLGFSQDELASYLNVTQGTVSSWLARELQGKPYGRRPSVEKAFEIQRISANSVTAEYLLQM